MSNTVLVKKAPISTSDSIFFLTITEPVYTFSCDYSDNGAYIWFNDDENIKLYKKLQIAEGMLKEDSNFAGLLAKELRRRGESFEKLDAILVVTTIFANEEVFPIEKNSDIEEMVRAIYRKQEDCIVMDDDLEDEIINRMYKVYIVQDFVEARYKEEVVAPMVEEQLKRVIFFSEEDKAEYRDKVYKQLKGGAKEFLNKFKLHENSSEESKLYLELLKAKAKGDNERMQKTLLDLKCI